MAQYLLSVWHDDEYDVSGSDMDPAELEKLHAQVGEFNRQVMDAGAWVFGGGLHPASSATVVRPADSGLSMTDGPFAETREQMGGFWVIEAPDFEAALEWARKAAAACMGPVELRPFQDE